MLDHFLTVAYQSEKKASNERALIDKLKQLPMEELQKIASGDPTSKLAYFDSCVGPGNGGWLEQFKGTPLLEQAVEIERSLLQCEVEEQARRQEQRGVDQQHWDARDALQLKKRMLELELVAGPGGAGPEAQEEKGVQMLEQAQATERATGEGGEPHEQAEDQAIQQFRQAQSQEAAAKTQEQPPKEKSKGGVSVAVKQAFLSPHHAVGGAVMGAGAGALLAPPGSRGLGAALGGTVGGLSAGRLAQIAQTPTDPAEVPGEFETEDPAELRAHAKDWRAHGHNVRQNPTAHRIIRGAAGAIPGAAIGAGLGNLAGKPGLGALLGAAGMAGLAASTTPRGTMADQTAEAIEAHLAQREQAAASKVAHAVEAGQLLAGGLNKEALSHGRIIDAVRKAPEGRLNKAFEHGVGLLGKAKSSKLVDQADTLATASGARLSGGDWKRSLTTLKALRKESGGSEDSTVRAAVAKKYPGLVEKKSSLLPALLGAGYGGQKAHESGRGTLGGVARGAIGADLGGGAGAMAGEALGAAVSRRFGVDPALARLVGTGAGEVAGGVAGYKALTRGYNKPKEEPKEKKAGIIGSALNAGKAAMPGVIAGAKGVLGAGKGLAQTAHAAGGMGQVAKSFGNVATQFAKSNPLAAAGIAGGAGLMAGRALTPSQPRM